MKNLLCTAVLLAVSFTGFTQVGINTTNVHPSAILQLEATDKGFLMPRMTTFQRNQIVGPVEGLMIYNTDRNAIQFYKEISPSLKGWYDTACTMDAAAFTASLPAGITLDFSDLTQNGKVYPAIIPGTEYSASAVADSPVGSVGPIPLDLANIGGAQTHLTFTDKAEAGNLGTEPNDHKFVLRNNVLLNAYNAGRFLSRTTAYSSSDGDLLSADLTAYSGDFDLVLVARFDELSLNSNASFFSTGGFATNSGAFQIGVGTAGNDCSNAYYNLKFSNERFCGGIANRVPLDTEFHRFRLKYTDNTASADAILEFYIDGVLVESYQNLIINNTKISRLDLFNNRGRNSFAKSSISFLGIYPGALTVANFEALDKYLACKFESQL